MALTTLRPDDEMVNSLLEDMLTYQNPDGTFQVSLIISGRGVCFLVQCEVNDKQCDLLNNLQTYFEREKPRTDAVVSANVLTCFYTFGRGHSHGLELTVRMIHNILLQQEYLHGTRYYPSPDCCLFFFARLLRCSDAEYLQTMLGPLLKERIQERVGLSGSAMDIAMRILACKWLGLESGDDRHVLLDKQCEDGGWDASWMCTYGSSGIKIGNRGVTTALAIRALEL